MSQSRTITTTCPNCSESFDLSSEAIGNKGRCQACQTKFIIEENVAPAAPAPTPKVAAPVPPVAPLKSSKSGSKLPVFVFLIAAATLGTYIYQEQQKGLPEIVQPIQVAEKTVVAESGEAPAEIDPVADTTPHEVAVEDAVEKEADAAPIELGKSDDTNTDVADQATEPKKVIATRPQNSGKKTKLSRLNQTFPITSTFKSVDIGLHQKTYPNVHQGWMPSSIDQADEAKRWGSYLGPLGVRIRSHVPQMQNRPAFAAIIPKCIRTTGGGLALSAAEVVQIAPGSPAEGHLEIGDLIVGIEGEILKSGNQYRPGWDFMHKDRRELQLMLGEKIDQAQGRGDIRLTVMRYPEATSTAFTRELKASNRRVTTKTISVNPGDEVRLIVDPNGHNDDDHLAWLSPKLLGKGKSLNLSVTGEIQPDSATTGWGEVVYNKDLTGKSLKEKGISVHAPSTIVFTVPEGYHSFQTSMQVIAKKGDLTASVEIAQNQQPLPVHKTELWKGKGDNQSAGVQPFDIEVSEDGYLTLETHHFDNNLGGDGSLWMDVTLKGDYGTKKLFDIPWESAAAGYGRAAIEENKEFKGKKYDKALNLHAHGSAVWKLPKGTKQVKGKFSAASYGKVQPIVSHTNLAFPLTGVHKDKLVKLRFPIGKAGSFSSTYPKNCPKSELTAKRHTAWLAAQQRENGSWPRLHGYTSDGWDTAWCALALMSSGDSQYDEKVRKAAYRIAYDTTPSEWIAERAMRLIFLSEYYLRTKDSEIVAGIQAAYHQVIACCKTDYMAGHKVNGFGYGIAGQHYGTGHMALAVAMATKTPITFDKKLAFGIIKHAGEVCVNGTYAYGRGRRMARDESNRQGGGGNAMIGPGMLGAILAGGHQSSIKEVLERWDATIGDADNSHASSSLAFIFSTLAMAAEDESLFLKSMQNFKYKMTLDDNWEGGILKAAFPLDFQGGESVTGVLIRSAGSILVLNATKHNLAITGKKEFKRKTRITTSAVSEWGNQVHSYYLRNWCIAQELLGRRAPKGIAKGISELNALPRTMELVPSTNKVVTRLAPSLIAQIAKDRTLSDTQRAYAIELLCGLDFIIRANLDGNNQKVELVINQPLHQLNWLDEDKEKHFDKSPLTLDATVKITGQNLRENIEFKTEELKHFNLDSGSRKFSSTTPLKNGSDPEFTGDAEISFKVGKTRVKYKRPLFFNSSIASSRGGGDKANLRRLKLKLRIAPRAYYQSQPLIIAGSAFDCMYLEERMVEVIPPEKGVINIHEGDTVTVDLSSENLICAWVNSLEFDEMTQVNIAKPRKIRDIRGTIEGDLKNLEDFDYDTFCEIKHEAGKSIIEYDFGKEVTLNGLDANYKHGCFIRVWFKDGSKWTPLVWDNYSSDTSQNPTFPDTKAKLWRVEIQNGGGKRFHTLRFYHNPNIFVKQAQPAHVRDKKLLPADLQPK